MSSRTWHIRTYRFRPPRWQPRSALNARLLFLFLLTLGWLAIYAALAVRLWRAGLSGAGLVEIALGVLAFFVGVPLVLAWWTTILRWHGRLRRSDWPALTNQQALNLSPSEFEEYVARRLFARHGYTVQNTPDVGDGGVDILVTDPQGRRAVVQCKRYRSTVGESVVRDLYGAMIHHGASMAYLVTTAGISDAARRWVTGKPIDLIDGDRLEWLVRADPSRRV